MDKFPKLQIVIPNFKKYCLKTLKFFIKYSYLLLVLIPFVIYWAILSLYIPQPFHLVLQLDCDKGVCQIKTDNQSIDTVNNDIQNQINRTNRMDKLSIPFGSFINFYPKITNQTTITLSVSQPAQNLSQQAYVRCQLFPQTVEMFSYGSGITFANKTTLHDLPDTLKSVVNTLIGCFRGFSSSNNFKAIVSPNGIVSMQYPKIDFRIDFIPDSTSKILVRIEAIIIFLGLLPLTAIFAKFLRKGWYYFIE